MTLPGPSRRSAVRALLALGATPAVLASPLLSGAAYAAAPPAGRTSRYTMTAFTYSSERNMYVYDSADATGFNLVKGPAYTPPSGLVRDPSVFRHTDGLYYVTYTSGWTGNTIGFARSSDRQSWTFLGNITLALPGVGNAWAPEWFIDPGNGSVNIIVSLHLNGEATGAFNPYVVTATNSTLTAWSTPTPLTGAVHGPGYIDTTVVKIGSTYHAFLKSTSTKSIDFATAGTLTGPWTITKTGNWVDLDGEGPVLVELDNGGWRIFFEDYNRRRFYYADSYDTFKTWTTPAELPGLSGTVKHLTVVKETVTGGVTLPLNTTRSFQSVNYPDRYMRHRDFLGYTDPVTADSTALTKQDATFTVVPGLADPNCYSLRTASGLYARHSSFRIRVDGNDGTAAFAKDATFNAHPGTAAGSVALESYNFPGYYIRHRNGELWVDRYAATDLFRADRSFQPVTPWA
ncbi:glycoside hydrolase family 43 protein [Streptomyces guryensis]|uniref:Glycoside hydrolase family 43 protein n=1 Tax=Streptomyces guryensis TaxID=2886947 RepID=A0A9Q3VX40_9ACTN|nr:glycoside hydrolase family 43 protein [Streptomyces guryensis]MCD9879742.1 glycoside hydrolase family 43 protein [Streptomyces guryensis]